MTRLTEALHEAFLRPLDAWVARCTAIDSKPLEVDLDSPRPPRLRVYAYSLVGGAGTVRPTEYKSVLRVPGQEVGSYGAFEYSSDRVAIVFGYSSKLDVFVMWDAGMHLQFKNGGNIQVKDTTVLTAAATGWAEQQRTLASGKQEAVIACQSWTLPRALDLRVMHTGVSEIA